MRSVLFLSSLVLSLLCNAAWAQDEVLAIEWEDLLSAHDLETLLNPPVLDHEGVGGWQEQLGDSPEADAYRQAMQSVDVNPDLINKRVLIPGFIVPLAYNAQRRVTEFLLVPFFGACIHLPPPPPNQVIHVSYERGVTLENFYDAYTIHGLLTSEVIEGELATSAYKLQAEGASIYSY